MRRGIRPLFRCLGWAFAASWLAACTVPESSPPFRRHAIAAANPYAAAAGREVLRSGGSAVDAAIAAQMVLTLVEPQSSGIGGGAFLLHFRAADGRLDAYDGRETAPAEAHGGMFLDASGVPRAFPEVVAGGLSVGVPGLLRVLELAHRDHGRLRWSKLFEPAIRVAEEGFEVSPRLHALIGRVRDIALMPETRAYFFTPEGAPAPVGARLRNPALAATLRTIAAGGADAFHRGPLAQTIVAAARDAARNPGLVNEADIANYRAIRREAMCGAYRVWRICVMPPPSSGGVATLQILGMLERFDLAAMAPASALAIHLLAEASKLAYADRAAYLADPGFVTVPAEGLVDPAYLRARSGLISATRTMALAAPGVPPRAPRALAPDESLADTGTSHISVIDGDGNALAFTTSIESAFGARLMVGGFLLNNHMTDFSFRPEIDGRPVANRVEPGKRPRSTMAPTLVFDRDGRLVIALGSPGGSRIVPYVVKALTGVLDWGLEMQAAIDLPNHVNRNGATELEQGTEVAAAADTLAALGHKVEVASLDSGLHGLRVTVRGIEGGADRRREGVVLGD
jgi:gamma-glutamyltranspeptidase/glutathione hydrolase